jgi:hypothetical protein
MILFIIGLTISVLCIVIACFLPDDASPWPMAMGTSFGMFIILFTIIGSYNQLDGQTLYEVSVSNPEIRTVFPIKARNKSTEEILGNVFIMKGNDIKVDRAYVKERIWKPIPESWIVDSPPDSIGETPYIVLIKRPMTWSKLIPVSKVFVVYPSGYRNGTH